MFQNEYSAVFNGDESFLLNHWNKIDFFIVVMSVMSLALPDDGPFHSLKIIRIIRLLRPLRVIKRNKGLKVSIQSLIVSIDMLHLFSRR